MSYADPNERSVGVPQRFPPAGWYPDPAGSPTERFWDGSAWTSHTRAAYVAAPPRPYIPVTAAPYEAWAPGPRYAHWGWRVLAMLLDQALIVIVTVVVGWSSLMRMNAAMTLWQRDLVIAIESGGTLPSLLDYPDYFVNALVVTGISWGLYAVYNVAMLSTVGATLGKLAVGIRVSPATAPSQGRIDVGQAVGRVLLVVVFSAVPILNVVNYLSPLWSVRRQALHDSLAKTVVIKIS